MIWPPPLLRQLVQSVLPRGNGCRLSPFRTSHRGNALPIPPSIATLESSKDMVEARSWISRFGAVTIPKGLVEMSFSRSSGPGGQVCIPQLPVASTLIPNLP